MKRNSLVACLAAVGLAVAGCALQPPTLTQRISAPQAQGATLALGFDWGRQVQVLRDDVDGATVSIRVNGREPIFRSFGRMGWATESLDISGLPGGDAMVRVEAYKGAQRVGFGERGVPLVIGRRTFASVYVELDSHGRTDMMPLTPLWPMPLPTPDASGSPYPTPDPSGSPYPTPDPSGSPYPTPDPSGSPYPTPDPNYTPDPNARVIIKAVMFRTNGTQAGHHELILENRTGAPIYDFQPFRVVYQAPGSTESVRSPFLIGGEYPKPLSFLEKDATVSIGLNDKGLALTTRVSTIYPLGLVQPKGGSLALVRENMEDTQNPEMLVDFVQWGYPGSMYERPAVDMGLWSPQSSLMPLDTTDFTGFRFFAKTPGGRGFDNWGSQTFGPLAL